MTEEAFRDKMCEHMEAQTNFLKSINEAVSALRVVGKFISYVGTIGGSAYGLWTFFHPK